MEKILKIQIQKKFLKNRLPKKILKKKYGKNFKTLNVKIFKNGNVKNKKMGYY